MPLVSRRHIFFLSALLTLSGLAAAQAPQAASANQQQGKSEPVLQMTSRAELVLVSAVVTDKSGAHIPHLSKDDFTVLLDGNPRRIATFEEVTASAAIPRRVENKDQFSNRLGNGESALRTTIIAVDLINTPSLDQVNLRHDLLRFLTTSPYARGPMALVALTRNGLKIVQDLSTDPAVLAIALSRMSGTQRTLGDPVTGAMGLPELSSAGSGSDPVSRMMQAWMEMEYENESDRASVTRRLAATATLLGLQQIAEAYGGLPGRKSLVWMTAAFPFSISDALEVSPIRDLPQTTEWNGAVLLSTGRASLADILPYYERTWQMLNQAQVAVYPVDVRGMQVTNIPSAGMTPSRTFQLQAAWDNEETLATMREFGEMTGGLAYVNNNDLARGIEQAARDSESYYVLGFYLTSARERPGWHRLQTRVSNPGARVRARSGFFVTETGPTSPVNRESDIRSALASPLEATSMWIDVAWKDVKNAVEAGKKRVSFRITVPGDAFTIDEADSRHMLLEYVAIAITPDRRIMQPAFSESLESRLQESSLEQIHREGFVYENALLLPPGEYKVRFVVRDGLSGRMGTVTAPLQVR